MAVPGSMEESNNMKQRRLHAQTSGDTCVKNTFSQFMNGKNLQDLLFFVTSNKLDKQTNFKIYKDYLSLPPLLNHELLVIDHTFSVKCYQTTHKPDCCLICKIQKSLK